MFLIYKVYGRKPTDGQVGWCAFSEYETITKSTMDELKKSISILESNPEIVEDCGWILEGGEKELETFGYYEALKDITAPRESVLVTKTTKKR